MTEPYRVIYADPPWSFKSWTDKGKNRAPDAMVRQKGLAERHYPTMTPTSLKSLLAEIDIPMAKDCALLMWTVPSNLEEALELGAAWGFKYKTKAFCWAKQNKVSPTWALGLGYWTRAQTEDCLLFTRGKPKRKSASVRELIVSPRREHSQKPDEAYERIEELLDGPYIELFARNRRPGWDSWGNQLPPESEAA